MKKLFLFASITFSLSAFAQDFIVENKDHFGVLYRGFENKVSIGQVGSEIEGFEIEPINCEVRKSSIDGSTSNYIVKTRSSEKTAKIIFRTQGQAVDSAAFIIRNLPSPSFYWGNQISTTVSSESNKLYVKYPPSELLKADFVIDNWQFTHGNQVFSGDGNVLSDQVMAYMASINTGETLEIAVVVLQEAGVASKMSGSWILQ